MTRTNAHFAISGMVTTDICIHRCFFRLYHLHGKRLSSSPLTQRWKLSNQNTYFFGPGFADVGWWMIDMVSALWTHWFPLYPRHLPSSTAQNFPEEGLYGANVRYEVMWNDVKWRRGCRWDADFTYRYVFWLLKSLHFEGWMETMMASMLVIFHFCIHTDSYISRCVSGSGNFMVGTVSVSSWRRAPSLWESWHPHTL